MTFGDEKMRIDQSQLLKIKSQILSNLFNEKYGLRVGEFISYGKSATLVGCG